MNNLTTDDFYLRFNDQNPIEITPKIFGKKQQVKIVNPKTSNEGFDLTTDEKNNIQPSFFLYIPAPTGSGKTSLIRALLNEKRYFNKRFKYIII